MLARVLAMALCLSVCVCRFSIETSTYPTLYYKEIQVRLKRCTSLCNFAPNSGLRKFRHGISIVEACYQLGLRQVDAQSVINWDVVGQLTGQYLRAPTLDHCSLSHRSSSSVYSAILSRGSISDSMFRELGSSKPDALQSVNMLMCAVYFGIGLLWHVAEKMTKHDLWRGC